MNTLYWVKIKREGYAVNNDIFVTVKQYSGLSLEQSIKLEADRKNEHDDLGEFEIISIQKLLVFRNY